MSKILYVFATLPPVFGTFWMYNHYCLPKYVGDGDLKEKVAIITGGSSGIGQELAHRLAIRNATVILACKDMSKCHSIREEMSKSTNNANIFCSEMDLESSISINRFVKRVSEKFQKIDILVNSAGYRGDNKLEITNEFMEKHLAINAVGPHLLTKRLIPLLTASDSARVLYLICPVYAFARIFENDINFIESAKTHFIPVLAFGQSQLMRFLSMRHFSDKYGSSKITFNACNPGSTNTNFYGRRLLNEYRFYRAIKFLILRDVSMAAETPEMCCVSDELNGVTGLLYKNMKPVEYPAKVLDPQLMERAMSVFNEFTNEPAEIHI